MRGACAGRSKWAGVATVGLEGNPQPAAHHSPWLPGTQGPEDRRSA